MEAKDIIKKLEEWLSPSLIDKWDKSGFQIGDSKNKVKGILLALDITNEVIDYAIKTNLNMIISHHPFIFSPLETITDKTYKGRLIKKIINHDLVIYNAHSNLDLVEGGVNDILSQKLGLKNPIPLRKVDLIKYKDPSIEYGYGRVGEIDPISLDDLIDKIKENLKASHLIVYGKSMEGISKIALCGGSGSDFIMDAKEKAAQVYITGDIKYHDSQLAYEEGIILIDATHYFTEKPVLNILKNYLLNIKDEIRIEVYDKMTFPFSLR